MGELTPNWKRLRAAPEQQPSDPNGERPAFRAGGQARHKLGLRERDRRTH